MKYLFYLLFCFFLILPGCKSKSCHGIPVARAEKKTKKIKKKSGKQAGLFSSKANAKHGYKADKTRRSKKSRKITP